MSLESIKASEAVGRTLNKLCPELEISPTFLKASFIDFDLYLTTQHEID